MNFDKKPLQDHIDEVMDWFYFDRVEKVMRALEWQWSSVKGVPTLPDIRAFVRDGMKKAYVRGHHITGGFDIRYNKEEDYFTVQFIAAGWETNMEGIE